jgi:hypothetical protein
MRDECGTNEKTASDGGFFRNFGLALLLARSPLLHRLWAGIAKVKIKVKVRERHGFLLGFAADLDQ